MYYTVHQCRNVYKWPIVGFVIEVVSVLIGRLKTSAKSASSTEIIIDVLAITLVIVLGLTMGVGE